MKTLQKIRDLITPEPDLTPEEVDAATHAAQVAIDVIRPVIR